MNYKFLISIFLFLLNFNIVGQEYPTPVEGDYVIDEFEFESGEKIKNLNLHYTTLGKPTKGKDGKINNAVLIKPVQREPGNNF